MLIRGQTIKPVNTDFHGRKKLYQSQEIRDYAFKRENRENKALLFESEIEYTNRLLDLKDQLRQAEIDNQNVLIESSQKQIEMSQTVSSAFSDMLSTFAEENEALAAFAKAVALFNIGLDISKAIAAIPAMAAVGDPYTYALRVATAIATVMASAAKAHSLLKKEKQPKAPRFAKGGTVSGKGSGNSDTIVANLSNGESILTAPATAMFAPVLSALNQIGGGVPINVMQSSNQVMGEEMLARAFAKGVASLPNPIVAVEEINRVDRRVEILENLSLT